MPQSEITELQDIQRYAFVDTTEQFSKATGLLCTLATCVRRAIFYSPLCPWHREE